MAVDKLGVIGWLVVAILISGLWAGFAGRFLHGPLAVVHKLLAVLVLVWLLRISGMLRALAASPGLRVTIVVFALAYLAAFITGIVQSIPSCAGSLWLNLHRVGAATAAIACGIAARMIVMAAHP
jgi:hypothetical protein